MSKELHDEEREELIPDEEQEEREEKPSTLFAADEEREEAEPASVSASNSNSRQQEPFRNDSAVTPAAVVDDLPDEELPERESDSDSTVSDDSNASSNGGNKDPAVVAAMLAEGEQLRLHQEEADRVRQMELDNEREKNIVRSAAADGAALDEEEEEEEGVAEGDGGDASNKAAAELTPEELEEQRRQENQRRQIEILRALGGAPNNFFGVDVTSLRLGRFVPPQRDMIVDEDDEMSGDDEETISKKRRNKKRKAKMGNAAAAGGNGNAAAASGSNKKKGGVSTTIDGKDLAAMFPQSVQDEIDLIIAALRDTENAIMGRGGAAAAAPQSPSSPSSPAAGRAATPINGLNRPSTRNTPRPTSAVTDDANNNAGDGVESQFVYRQLYSALSAPIGISDPRLLLGLDEGFFGKIEFGDKNEDTYEQQQQVATIDEEEDSTSIFTRMSMQQRINLARLIYEGKLPATTAAATNEEEEEYYCCGKDSTKTHNQGRIIYKIQNGDGSGGSNTDGTPVLLLLDNKSTAAATTTGSSSSSPAPVFGKVPAKEEFVAWRRWTELNPQACVFGNGGQNYPSEDDTNNNGSSSVNNTETQQQDGRRAELTLEELQREYRRETETTFEHIPEMPPGEGIIPTICIHHLPPLPLLPKVYTEHLTSTLEKSRAKYAKEMAIKVKENEEANKQKRLANGQAESEEDSKPLSHIASNNNGTSSSPPPPEVQEYKKVSLYGPTTFQPSFLPSILDDHFFLLGLVACLNAHPPQLPELQPIVREGESEGRENTASSPDGLNDDTLRAENGSSTSSTEEERSRKPAPQKSSPYSFFNQVFASLEHIDRGLYTVRAYADEELDLKPYLGKSIDEGEGLKAKRNNPKSKSLRKRQQQDAEREKDPNYFRLVVPLPVYVTLDTMLPAGTAAYSIAGTIEEELQRNPSRAAKYRYNRSLPPADIDHIVGRTYEDGTECWAPMLAKAYATIKQRQYLQNFTTGEMEADNHLRNIRRDSPAIDFDEQAKADSRAKLFQYLGGYAALHGGSAPDVIKTFMNPDEAVYVQWNNRPISKYYNLSQFEDRPPSSSPISEPISRGANGGSVSNDSATLGRARAATEREEKRRMLRGLAAAARTTQGFARDQLWWMLRQATDAHQPTMLTNVELCSNSVASTVASNPSRLASGIPPCSFGSVPAPIDGFVTEDTTTSIYGTTRPSSGRAVDDFDEAANNAEHTYRPYSAGNDSNTSSISRLKHPDYRIRYSSYSSSEFALGKVPDGGSTSDKTLGNVSMTGSMMGFGGNRSMSIMMSTNGSLANLNGSLGSEGGGGVGGCQPPMPVFNWDYGVVVLCAVEINLDADSTIVDPYARAMIKKRRKAERQNNHRKERIALGDDPNVVDDDVDAEDEAAEEEDSGLVRLVKVRSVYRTNHPNYSKLRGEWSIPGGGGKPQEDNGNDDDGEDEAAQGDTVRIVNGESTKAKKKKKISNGHWTSYLQEQLQYSVDVVREQQSENMVWWMSMDELFEQFNYLYTGMNSTAFSTQSLMPFYATAPKEEEEEDASSKIPTGKKQQPSSSKKKFVLSMPHCPYTVPPPRLQQAIEVLKKREDAALKREKEDAFKGHNATLNRNAAAHAASKARGSSSSRKASLASRRASRAEPAAAAAENTVADGSSTTDDATNQKRLTAGTNSLKPVESESPSLLLSLLEGAQYFNVFAGMDEEEVEKIQQALPAPPASKTANPALSQEQQAEREEEEERDDHNNHNNAIITKMVPVMESPGASYAAAFYPHFLLTVDKVNTGKIDESAGLAAIAGFDFTGANGGPNLIRYQTIFDVKPGPVAMGTQLKVVKRKNPQTGEEEESEDWTETDDESNALGQSTTTTATTTATNLAAQAASQSALQLKFTLKMPIPPGFSAASKACAPPQKKGARSSSNASISARARRMRNSMTGMRSSQSNFETGSVASYYSAATTAANAASQAQFPTDFVVQLFRVPNAVRQASVRTLVPVATQSPIGDGRSPSPGGGAALDLTGVDVLDTESVIADPQQQQAAVKPVYNLPTHTQVNVRPSIVKKEKTEKQKEKERKDRHASLASGKTSFAPAPPPPAAAPEQEDISPTVALMTAAELIDGERFFRATFEAEVNSGLYNIVIAPAANDPHRAVVPGLEQPSSALPAPVTSVSTCLNMPTFAHIAVEKSGKNRRSYRCGVFHLPK